MEFAESPWSSISDPWVAVLDDALNAIRRQGHHLLLQRQPPFMSIFDRGHHDQRLVA
jgi:hypothetical protein